MEGPSAPQDTIPGLPQDTTPLSNAADTPSKFLGEQDAVRSCVNRDHLLTMKDLTEAGELMYTTDTLKTISEKLIADFNATEPKQFSKLMKDCLTPMMYLLKRELNLLDFTKFIKQGLMTNRTIPRPSQRMLVDILLKNSEDHLAQTIVKLLSKRNAVPLFEVQGESQEFVPYIIHAWDYEKPTILSFGIGPCDGKSSLLNSLFLSNFEQRVSSSYFQQTIDVDFGYSFIQSSVQQSRPINVADVHGSMSLELLDKVSRLFDGFIIHVNTKFLLCNLPLVKQFLDRLPDYAYRCLLVRDSSFDEDNTVLQQLRSNNKGMLRLPQIAHKTNVESQYFLNKLRDIIYHKDNFSPRKLSKNTLEAEFHKLLPPERLRRFDDEKALICSIEATLINGEKKHFPLYNIFVDVCQMSDKLSHIDFYGSRDSEDIFNTQNALYKLEVKLRPDSGNQKDCGEAFRIFFSLLQNTSKFNILSIIASALKKKIDRTLKADQLAIDLPYEKRLSMEIHWRNALVCYDHIPCDAQKQELVQHYRDMIASGQPFEIIDGDNFYYQSSFLEKVMVDMKFSKVFVISIIGPQNSGKSTLLNYMFGTLFDVRDGRCTRGK
ncbi:unnamed protein product [Rotaria socialis]|nr:unnamed protein product [Rotaria socialis]CAF4669684.1 unnamed protein product [Rotaria socialis]